MSTVTLHPGDNRETLRRLIDQGVRVHSVVTDPPYGLTSITKRFGKEGAAPAKHGTDGAFSRASGGFMGKVWDGTGIERDPEFWRLIWEILLPGGFVFAFSGSRTGHWQACAMEMAGFIMHPMHGWVYGSGMPKAHNAGRAVEGQLRGGKARYSARDGHLHVSEGRAAPGAQMQEMSARTMANGESAWSGQSVNVSHPYAEPWKGWAYGTQTQKPALEPIYLGQKPFSEKNGALNLLKHGVGAMNIDACRVTAEGRPLREVADFRDDVTYSPNSLSGRVDGSLRSSKAVGTTDLGRWPANLLHDGSEAVIDLFPDSKGQRGAILGTEPSRTGDANTHCYGEYGARPPTPVRGDEGSAARFFHGFTLTDEDYAWAIAAGLIDDVPALLEPIRYAGKAKKSDRAGSKHPTVKPVALMEYCITHLTPKGGTVLDPFAGSGTTGEAAQRLGFDCILMEAEPDYVDFLRQRFDLPDEIEGLLALEVEDLLDERKSPNDETSIVYPHIVGTLESDIMSLLS